MKCRKCGSDRVMRVRQKYIPPRTGFLNFSLAEESGEFKCDDCGEIFWEEI